MNLIIETERLLLRELLLSDAEPMFKMDSNPIVHKYLWNKPTNTIEEILKTIELVRNQYIENNIGRFAMISKETNEFMGWAGLKFNTETINNKTNFYDIGYRLDEPFWGKGYASEASFAWLTYGFNTMKIKTMTASAQSGNDASNRILQKIGMQLTEQYLEDEVLWNWYELENKNI
ncbi:putative ribosomal-protein-amino-acid N-acetyltransferase [Flavobacterium enshiense DK69]|uniref:GNAT family acetyltransferase n=1 Tax=Flavobacterium enshiense DK69 TaxID=1107311 RepID=V6SE23_9FLAO|nr:GNAT family N-acetyltransferase [Flavobacterium enshiense]ESU24826.1 putative ribosomal-protein-amino-acid N-acetyltransferase [Flavobacterium enshiense DK69]KGO96720.1 GNAT family acetyltransferase [Flavobacterium enshiense DK69]